jgi:hypothetical protein
VRGRVGIGPGGAGVLRLLDPHLLPPNDADQCRIRLIQGNGSPPGWAHAGEVGVQPRRVAGRSTQDVTVSAVITASTATSATS